VLFVLSSFQNKKKSEIIIFENVKDIYLSNETDLDKQTK